MIERLRTYQQPGVRTVFLSGNHEEVLLRILRGESRLIPRMALVRRSRMPAELWRDAELLANWTTRRRSACSARDSRGACRVPRELRRQLPLRRLSVRPRRDPAGGRVEQQRQSDLRWIREAVPVRRHRPRLRRRPRSHDRGRSRSPANRIGIDTGAYRSGVLTALAIEGGESWILDTRSAGKRAASVLDLIHFGH